MISVHKKYKSSVMASMSVNKNDVSRWGIFKLSKNNYKNNNQIIDVIEKGYFLNEKVIRYAKVVVANNK